jgi:hypothetical protein
MPPKQQIIGRFEVDKLLVVGEVRAKRPESNH